MFALIVEGQEVSRHRTAEAAREKMRLFHYRLNRDITTRGPNRRFLKLHYDFKVVDLKSGETVFDTTTNFPLRREAP